MSKRSHTFIPFIFLFSSFAANIYAANESLTESSKSSWRTTALRLQREIDLDVPLNEATFIGTHNSYNSKSYATPLRYIDPNQTLSIFDQLEAGIRSIELDAHWTINDRFSKEILLCHGQDNHLGCGMFDRKITEGLQEIRDWLKANPNEIVLLYIERHLDGHEPRLTSYLEQYLGDYIYKASNARKRDANSHSCVALPSTSLTKADILRAGKQLLIVTKNCDGNNPPYKEQDKFNHIWNDYAFAGIGDIPSLPFTFIDSTITDFKSPPDCSKSNIFSPDIKHSSVWRIYEDRTKLTDVIHKEKKLLDEDMQQLVFCGINWPTMDMLSSTDSRLVAAIWSWAPTYPQEGQGLCAINKKGEGIKNIPCDKFAAGFACQEATTHAIKALSLSGPWANGESACQLFAGKNWHFATPVNGGQMNTLNESMSSLSLQEVWLNYAADTKGHWMANKFNITSHP